MIEYIIDGQNRRIAKKLNGNFVRRWIYSGQLSPVAEIDSANNVISRFMGPYIVKSGIVYRLIKDNLGSIRLVINNSTGGIEQRLDYDEFGNVISNSNPDFQPFGYAGGLYDTQTKLVRFGARDYDAASGRWTTKDPIGFEGGFSNLFEYSNNDPINYVDPTGTQKAYVPKARSGKGKGKSKGSSGDKSCACETSKNIKEELAKGLFVSWLSEITGKDLSWLMDIPLSPGDVVVGFLTGAWNPVGDQDVQFRPSSPSNEYQTPPPPPFGVADATSVQIRPGPIMYIIEDGKVVPSMCGGK